MIRQNNHECNAEIAYARTMGILALNRKRVLVISILTIISNRIWNRLFQFKKNL